MYVCTLPLALYPLELNTLISETARHSNIKYNNLTYQNSISIINCNLCCRCCLNILCLSIEFGWVVYVQNELLEPASHTAAARMFSCSYSNVFEILIVTKSFFVFFRCCFSRYACGVSNDWYLFVLHKFWNRRNFMHNMCTYVYVSFGSPIEVK